MRHMVHSQGESISGWNRNRWLALPVLLVTVTFVVSLGYGFVSDDRAYLVNNSNLLSQPVAKYFQHGTWKFSILDISKGQIYRPLELLNQRVQVELWGADPLGFHMVNVLGHLLVTVLVFFLLSLLVPLASGKSLALATSIFAVHPVQVEAVCWIVGNNNISAALCSFAGILLLFYAIDKKRSYMLIVAMLAMLAAMLTKESAYTLPGLLAILFFIRKETFSLKQTVLLTALSGILLLIVLLMRSSAVSAPELVYDFDGVRKLIVYFFGYLKMTLLPLPQRFYVSEPAGGMVAPWEMLIGFAVLSGFGVLVWKIKDGRRFFILSAGWYGLALAPSLAVAFHAYRPTFASRVLYLAIFSLSMIILWLMTNGPEKRRHFIERMAVVAIVFFTFVSVWTGSAWKNQGSFIQLALASTPDNITLHIDNGDYYAETGKLDEAVESYKLVAATATGDKDKIFAHERLGEIYAKAKSFDKARREFEALLAIDPGHANAHNGLGNVAWLSGDLVSAEKYYKMALMSNPGHTQSRKNLAAVRRLLSAK